MAPSTNGRSAGFHPANVGSTPSGADKFGVIDQLVRSLACHARSREFESR